MATPGINNTASPDLMAAVNPRSRTSADAVADATDKFMTLLVTQLRNQDPLNPLDNAQITSQLAQLSTVTGVNKLNDTLESLKESYRSSEAMAATNMIGHGVLVQGTHAELREGRGLFGVELDTPADSVQVVITDPSTGKEVQVIDMGAQPPGIIPVAWDGVPDPDAIGPDGKPVTLADGHYTVRVVATRGGVPLEDAYTLQFDSVASVTTGGKDGVRLNLGYAGAVTLADIKQIL